MPGPPPKRTSQRRRVNKPAVPLQTAVSDGAVRGPELTGTHSAVGRRFYESLRRSGQSQWFEPSDWSLAEMVVIAVDAYVKKPSAFMLTALHGTMSSLLVSEGDRRRLHIELEKAPEPESEQDAAISDLAEFRARTADLPS